MTWTTCLDCGQPSPEPRCEDHARPTNRPSRAAGYDAAWDRLSRRARRLQPFCSDCGATTDLTCDHSPEAWERKDAGLAIRLRDVDVVCRACNSRRGRARPTGVRAHDPRSGASGKAKSATYLGTILTSDQGEV